MEQFQIKNSKYNFCVSLTFNDFCAKRNEAIKVESIGVDWSESGEQFISYHKLISSKSSDRECRDKDRVYVTQISDSNSAPSQQLDTDLCKNSLSTESAFDYVIARFASENLQRSEAKIELVDR